MNTNLDPLVDLAFVLIVLGKIAKYIVVGHYFQRLAVWIDHRFMFQRLRQRRYERLVREGRIEEGIEP